MEVVSWFRKPLIHGGKTHADVSDDICRQVEGPPSRSWKLAITVSSAVLLVGLYTVVVLLWEGIVGWYWSRRYPYFRHTFAVQAEVENVN